MTARRIRRASVSIAGVVAFAILVSLAVPLYQKHLFRAREDLLKDELIVLRQSIAAYSADRQRPPQSLEELVSGGYLRAIPTDPITGSDRSWRMAVLEVHSGSDQISLNGTPYSNW